MPDFPKRLKCFLLENISGVWENSAEPGAADQAGERTRTMSLNETVSAERVHIGFFGLRNAGKSSLVNAVTGQNLSLVSDVKGTGEKSHGAASAGTGGHHRHAGHGR